MRVDATGRVVGFLEKPQTERELNDVAMDPAWLEARGIKADGRDCLASMGIYLFNRDTLVAALEKTNYRDFGKEVFPAVDPLAARAASCVRRLLGRHRHDPLVLRREPAARPTQPAVRAGVGHRADLHAHALAAADAHRRADDAAQPHGRRLHDRRAARGSKTASIGLRCQIGRNVTIRNSVIMGVDFYETPEQLEADRAAGRPPIGIGDGTVIENAIVDKNCHVGAGAGDRRSLRKSSESRARIGKCSTASLSCRRLPCCRDGWKRAPQR